MSLTARKTSSVLSSLACALALVLLTGCATPKKKPTTAPDKTSPTLTANDPCMNRLHDLSGGLLLFWFTEGRLPDSLDEMQALPGNDVVESFVCPVSGKPYVYRPDGIYLPEKNARIILYDPTPAHAGFRLAIALGDPVPGKPLVTRIIAVPESAFLLQSK